MLELRLELPEREWSAAYTTALRQDPEFAIALIRCKRGPSASIRIRDRAGVLHDFDSVERLRDLYARDKHLYVFCPF